MIYSIRQEPLGSQSQKSIVSSIDESQTTQESHDQEGSQTDQPEAFVPEPSFSNIADAFFGKPEISPSCEFQNLS